MDGRWPLIFFPAASYATAGFCLRAASRHFGRCPTTEEGIRFGQRPWHSTQGLEEQSIPQTSSDVDSSVGEGLSRLASLRRKSMTTVDAEQEVTQAIHPINHHLFGDKKADYGLAGVN
jgi:hypothetical protein